MQGVRHLRHVEERRAIRTMVLMILLGDKSAHKANEHLRVSNEKLNTRNERQRVSLDTE